MHYDGMPEKKNLWLRFKNAQATIGQKVYQVSLNGLKTSIWEMSIITEPSQK